MIRSCEDLMRVVLRPGFIPSNISSLWHGIRGAPDDDLIVATYRVGTFKVTWLDMDGQEALIAEDLRRDARLLDKEEVQRWVMKTEEQFFNLPSVWKRTYRDWISSRKVDDRTLWYGGTEIGAQIVRGVRVDKLNWFTDSDYFTDGRTIYIQMSAVENGESRWVGEGAGHADGSYRRKPRLSRGGSR
jgi:hypothetical protein